MRHGRPSVHGGDEMKSLRGRLLAYLGLAILVSTVLTVLVAAVLVRGHVRGQALRALERQAEVAAAVRGPGPQRVLVARGGRVRPARPRVAAAVVAAIPTGDGAARVKVRGRELLYAQRGRIVLVRRAGLAAADWRPFLTSLLLAGLGGMAVAFVVSFVLARRLSRPLRELAGAAGRVAAGDAGASVPVRGRDELADVATAFNAMSAQLAASRAREREFLMSVSHELRTPLTAVRGYAEALADRAVAPEEAAAVIGAEAGRLERLVDDLLDLARLERRTFAVARGAVDLVAVARSAHERASAMAADRGLPLELDAAETAWGMGDPDRLLQALSNLVDNALRITPPGGEVTIRARPGELTVLDTGPGLSPEDLPRAFDRFYLHARRGAPPGGAGLGLAVVYELAAAMGGTATVTNRRGGGAAFTVRIPSARAPAAASAAGA